MIERIEWAIRYPGESEPRPADEWSARNWVRYWNQHRGSQDPAVLVRRIVVISDWKEVQ